jgi:hypothetical protein
MPDKYHVKYLDIIDILIDRMSTDVESTVVMILRTLTRLSTKSNYNLNLVILLEECRSKILKCGGLSIGLSMINHRSDEIKYELYKLIFNLN